MRLLFVVQRYGREVVGGAELHCRQFATQLASRGHQVHALTSCAQSYVDWADHYPPGTSVLDEVVVHRLPVVRPRDNRIFGGLDHRAILTPGVHPQLLQRAWMDAQGPMLAGEEAWLSSAAGDFDVVIFFTYLYRSTWVGLPAVSGAVPTVLHATAHREPHFAATLFDAVLRLPTVYAYSTEEEAQLVAARTGGRRPGRVIGIGTEQALVGEGARFRRHLGLGERPYLVYVGRVVPEKGATQLCDYFAAYKRRRPGPMALIVVGDPLREMPFHEDIVSAGYVSDELKTDALAGALALAQPSYYESFSMVLSEAWAQGRPALVQASCDVTSGQVSRSGGGIAYRGYAQFEAAIDLLVAEPHLADRLGALGRRYVEQNYGWDTVMARYERLLGEAAAIRAAAAEH